MFFFETRCSYCYTAYGMCQYCGLYGPLSQINLDTRTGNTKNMLQSQQSFTAYQCVAARYFSAPESAVELNSIEPAITDIL